MKNRLCIIPIHLLEDLKVQPRGRHTPTKVKHLQASIESHGLLCPPVVFQKKNGSYGIVDGHRRIQSCKSLGFDKIECVVKEGIPNPDTFFMIANSYTRPVDGNEKIEILIRAGERRLDEMLLVMKPREKKNFSYLMELLGFDKVEELVRRGCRLASMSDCYKAVKNWALTREMPLPSPDKVVEWILKNRMVKTINFYSVKATSGQIRRLIEAIQKG